MKHIKTFENNLINKILDKISKNGYETLSNFDKNILDNFEDQDYIKTLIAEDDKKYSKSKNMIKSTPFHIDGHDLEDDIGKFVKYDLTKVIPKEIGSIAANGTIYEITSIQKTYNDEIAYRIGIVGKDDFGRVMSVDNAIFVNISEDEAISINKDIWDKI